MIESKQEGLLTENKYYVYLHKYAYGPKAGDVFYVGKGESYRANTISDRGALWLSCAVEYGRIVEIYRDKLSECCAYTIEKILVEKYRSIGQAEANITNGGSGAEGVKMSEESKAAIARSKHKPVYSSLGEEFQSASDAMEYLKEIGYKAASQSAISSCIYGRINYAYDRVWSFEVIPRHSDLRPIICCSNGMKFESQARAVSWLRSNGKEKANTQKIGLAINGKAKSAYGFTWWKEKAPYLGA